MIYFYNNVYYNILGIIKEMNTATLVTIAAYSANQNLKQQKIDN
jgi:hypothetical protein